MEKKERIGIYGGTFNPPHIGHVRAAEAFSLAIRPDKLLIIPDYLPPHKEYAGGATPVQRLQMSRIAFSHIDKVEISDMEIVRQGKSYTVHTLAELSREGRELYFLCGSDMFLTMESWHQPERIFELATVCYLSRVDDGGETLVRLREAQALYERKYSARIIPISAAVCEASSSEVRKTVASVGASDVLPQAVADYISAEGLYR